MKILNKSKKAVPPHPQVAEVIAKLLSTETDDLAALLVQYDVWQWPRSDLNAWIKVLNKFDAILEQVINEYDVNKLQLKDFTPLAKKTVCEILRFERLLLENSTNRKMFNSYDRLNSLLFTADLDVLIFALNLLLRPSQQYSAQPSVSHALNISTPRLQSLAKRWPYRREYNTSLVGLATPEGSTSIQDLPAEAREVNFSFYRSSGSGQEKKKETDNPENASRVPTGTPPSAVVSVHIDEQTLGNGTVMETLANAIETHGVPAEEKFELLCRIRAAKVLAKGHEVEREKLVVVRLLAIAIFGHTHPESQAMTALFLYEPDLVIHIAEVLQVDLHIPVFVQTAALAALDAVARYRGKVQEVLTAINAGVNHGILMSLVRKTVMDISNPGSTLPHSFVEALLSFVTFIASHAVGGNMIVGAGLIPILIPIIGNKLPQRLSVVSKTMQLVDTVLYSFTNAFQLFATSRGIEVLVDRIKFEIDLAIDEYGDEHKSREIFGSYGELPVARAAVLKHTLRSTHRMMQSSGTAEGLRGLIDTSLLKSIKKIIEYRGLFGPSVMPIAINIMATFVHNEPTSLAIIQEVGLPEAFYSAIESGLEPAIEVIQAIPNAIGALCLNQVGQDQLMRRPSIIPGIFAIFTSERHLKVLLDKENAVLIGTAIDELIRHHPLLKTAVFESLKSTLSKIEDLGNSYIVPDDLRQWYGLLPVSTTSTDSDVTMEDIEPEESTARPDNTKAGSIGDEDATPRAHDNYVTSYIDVLGRFLEGLFQHTPHCRDFISTVDGLTRLGKLTALPCLPYDFANSVASDSLVQVMRTLTEVATGETLLYLAKLVNNSLEETRDFWTTFDESSRLLSLVEITHDEAQEANRRFRGLIILHVRITLLSDVFATAGYAHGRAAIGLLQTLMNSTSSQLVSDLGALHRVSIWENIALKTGLQWKGINLASTPTSSPLERSPNPSTAPLPETDAGTTATTNGVQLEFSANISPSKAVPKHGPRYNNAVALKHLGHHLPASLSPFFQAMVKMFHARRNPDPAHRKQIAESSAIVADVLLKHLNPKSFRDKASTYTYYSVMLSLITVLLVDERATSHTLHTVQLLAFYRVGGLDALFEVCRTFMSNIESTMAVNVEDRSEPVKQDLVRAYGGLKVALSLLLPLISSKPLFDSGQTSLIITREKKDTEVDYFEPHNFLVRLRLAAVPLLRDLWTASWLISAPLSVSRSVVQTVLELINGENEENKGGTGGIGGESGVPSGLGGVQSRSTGPDEARIRQLTDMGFPRSAAERALTRTHNNVNAATELLLSHPFPLPPDPEPQETLEAAPAPEDAVAEVMIGDGNDSEAPVSEDATDSATPPLSSNDTPLVEESVVEGKSTEEWLRELNNAREPFKGTISHQALLLVDEHLSLIFDLHVAFIRPAGPHQEQAVRELVSDVKTFSPSAYDVQEQPLANRCRLLALVLCENPSSLGPELRSSLLDSLLALLLSNPFNTESGPSIPRWLAAHLLVTEALFTLADEPRVITLPKEDEEIPHEIITAGPPLTEARSIVFDFCLRLLAVPNLPSDELLSVLRLLVLLTRNHSNAAQFVKKGGLNLLFKRIKSSAVASSSSYIAIILRHVVEDSSMTQYIMRHAIKRYFSQPRTRLVEVGTYVRNCSAMALRDPGTFIHVTESLCQLDHPFYMTPHISLKSQTIPHQDKGAAKTEEGDMDVDTVPHSVPNESLESVVHFLLSELIKSGKSDAEATAEPTTVVAPNSEDLILTAPLDATNTVDTSETSFEDRQQYSCFLMQCLTELLFSYDSCKMAFLSYPPRKRLQTPAKDGTSKHRAAALNFLLSDLVTFGTISLQPSQEDRNRMATCSWAMSVIVALCVDSSTNHDLKEVSPDLVSVRKFVLEAVSRAIKDLPPSENLDHRYGRLVALADLCHRLLTVRFNAASRKQPDEAPTHIAKVMLEKNFVATLTNALAEVDLNYPNVRGLVASILRPLEYLTKIAIKMSRASHKGKDSMETKSESADSFDTDEDEDHGDVGNTGREETPDLYRNSALGMYGGEMEDVHFPVDDEMDDDEENDDEDVEMDFGDDTGSEDTSNTEDEGDQEDLENDTREAEEAWDEDEEDDLVENDEENDDEDDEDEEEVDDEEGEEEGDDEEMMWQDIRVDVDGRVESGEEADEDDEPGDPVPVVNAEDEDERDMSDEEDSFVNRLGILDGGNSLAEDIFGFGDSFVNGGQDSLRDGAGLFVSRRHRGVDHIVDNNVQVFGRGRNVPAPPADTTIHPLLLDSSSTTNRAAPGQVRGNRQTQRIVAEDGAELFQTIGELLGGGAVQLVHHIMTRGRGSGGPETIRLDVPPGALVNLERGYLHQRRPQGVLSASVRMERSSRQTDSRAPGRDFDPLLTLQRWAEEIKILHGDFVMERVNRLANHVILALLPVAIEAAKETARQREAQLKAVEAEQLAKEQEQALAAKQATEEEARQQVEDTTQSAEQLLPSSAEGPFTVSNQVMDTTVTSALDADTEMVDISPGASSASPYADEQAVSAAPNNPRTQEESNAESSTMAERVVVMIRGSPVDITDTGIDPTFLEALPDDMREEVLNQHVRDQRAARIERPADSQISSEFLDALPPEIRAEIIQQERLEQANRRVEETAPEDRTATGHDIDPASFIASLDPQLRQVVLLDSDDGFIRTLPPHILAEVAAYPGPHHVQPRLPTSSAPHAAPPRGKLPTSHDAIQLLDKAGVAILVRLLFFPQVLKKNLLFKVLVNLCENAKTRTELFNLLLNILQDGTGDLSAVDKSFSQMSFRSAKNPQTPKSIGKQKAGTDYFGGIALGTQTEAVPDLIAQRCLEGLTFIVSANETASLFFLTEHELPVGLRRAASKKGKGKEKQLPQTHYPIVLLLGLLDRQSLLKTPSIMESVVGLLATVTRPLTSLQDKRSGADEQPPASIETPTQPATSSNATVIETDPTITASASVITTVITNPTSEQAATEPQVAIDSSPADAALDAAAPTTSITAVEERILLANPPQIPHPVLRLIVNILTTGECSGRTFQQSLALIQHLSYIPDVRDVIASELRTKAQEFGQSLYSDLDELASALRDSTGDVLLGPVASKFSPASSVQAKLLRVLKTIDYMYTPRNLPSSNAVGTPEDTEKVQSIYESFRFTPLWQQLGDCLAIIEEKPDTEHVATVLLPLIEALMVVCKYVGLTLSTSSVVRALRASASPKSPSTPRESMEDLFVTFTDSHRKVLNLMVRNNPSLMSGSFSLLVHNPRVLDFDNKRNYFSQQLHRRPHAREHHGTLQLNVRRARVFEDSFQHLQRKTGDQIKYGKLSVRFYDEEGVDAGGVTREWFQILARQMFDPNNALFQPCAADRLTYQPNKNSWVNPEHLSFFKFVGRVIGKAIYDGRLLDAYFARSLYRQLLGKPVDYKDVEWVDPEYYNSLCWILENDPTALDLTFSVEADEFGINRIVPLKEGGESILVTQENKREFVQLSAQYRLHSSIKDQIESLLAGFYEIIPKDLITIFNEQELELLISGTPDIDVDEWRSATEYNGYSSSDPVIVWWWRALKSFNRDERAKVLSFATGTSRVPLGGFVELQGVQGVQRFSIHRAYGESDRLPQAHTCFNQIDLPQYTSYEMLRHQLLLAINEGGEGFGFA